MDAVGLGIVLQTARTSACSQLNQAITSLSSDTYIKDKGSAKDIDVSRELMGVSQAILRTNYRIDSLMMQHQGINLLIRHLHYHPHSPHHHNPHRIIVVTHKTGRVV